MSSRNSSGGIYAIIWFVILVGGLMAYKFLSPKLNGPPNAPNATLIPATRPPLPQPGEKGRIKEGQVLETPFILWGGDVATFHANGGLETKPETIFAKQGLNLKLKPGDNFPEQVERYLKGESPFLRGTLSMLGQYADKLSQDPKTQPVVFLQLTWSAGDHMVARSNTKTLNELTGKKIALQREGPHVGMLNDILRTARLDWKQINVVWTEEVTGDKGPAALFRKDPTIDACFVITPDMTELTGGLDKKGSGEKESVKGAHVLLSTATMSRSIADVYACRKDFYDANWDVVEKFAAGYLKSCEQLIDLKKNKSDGYKTILKLTQDIYKQDKGTKDAVKSDDDADGLISDATFVGLPGNVSFFTDTGNLSGFEPKLRAAVSLPLDPAKEPARPETLAFVRPDNEFYQRLRDIGALTGQASTEGRFKAELTLDTEETIYSFTITFEPNKHEFSAAQYGNDFKRALEQASLFGNAVIAVRGHADPGKLVQLFLKAAQQRGIIQRKGNTETYELKDGTPLNLNNTKKIVEIINQEGNLSAFDTEGNAGVVQLKDLVKNLQDLSDNRATEVRKAVVSYGNSQRLRLDASQIRAVGVGVTDPIVGYPTTDEEFARNRRVEFRIIRVPSDAIKTGDFDF